jgi:hypothetical protein
LVEGVYSEDEVKDAVAGKKVAASCLRSHS